MAQATQDERRMSAETRQNSMAAVMSGVLLVVIWTAIIGGGLVSFLYKFSGGLSCEHESAGEWVRESTFRVKDISVTVGREVDTASSFTKLAWGQ